MAKIDIDAFVVSLHNMMFDGSVEKARMERILSEQGLEIVDGKSWNARKVYLFLKTNGTYVSRIGRIVTESPTKAGFITEWPIVV